MNTRLFATLIASSSLLLTGCLTSVHFVDDTAVGEDAAPRADASEPLFDASRPEVTLRDVRTNDSTVSYDASTSHDASVVAQDVLQDVRARDVGWSPTKGGGCYEIDGIPRICCRPIESCCIVQGTACVPCVFDEATGECTVIDAGVAPGDG